MTPEIIRSATFEGMADENGFPTQKYIDYYTMLSGYVSTIITGFIYVSQQGRAMHPGQAGLDSADKARAFKAVTAAVHKNGGKIIAQIAHVGRQTTAKSAVGVSTTRSSYFGTAPRILPTNEIEDIVRDFASAALNAKNAGFDGVQIHCAHGYLIHQFLLKSINNRSDRYGDPYLFLTEVVAAVRAKCGVGFPLWVKISWGVDFQKFDKAEYTVFINKLDQLKLAAIEVSYGTMDMPLNIFRGTVPVRVALKYNPIYNQKSLAWKILCLPFLKLKIKGFSPRYNHKYALLAQSMTKTPVYSVGGVRSGKDIAQMKHKYISICRPFICEPDFLLKLVANPDYKSRCISCNICAIMVDTKNPLRCYRGKSFDDIRESY